MSKKKFNPEKLQPLESFNEHINTDKAVKFVDTVFNDISEEGTLLFLNNVFSSSLFRALISQDKKLKEEKGHNLKVFIRKFSIQNPDLKIYPVYIQSLRLFYKRLPAKQLNRFYLKEQKSLAEKRYDTAENKYLKNVVSIDWPKIFYHLDDYYLYGSILITLNKESPKWYSELKETIQDIPNEVKNYFEIKEGKLFDSNNLHSTTKDNSNFKLEKTKRMWNILQKEQLEPFNKAFNDIKEILFKSATTQDEYETLFKGISSSFEEIKKLEFSTVTLQNLLNHIHTVNDSKEPKYLFLYKLFQILSPSQFTSVTEWEASRKTSAVKESGFFEKEAKETFILEVKRFLRL